MIAPAVSATQPNNRMKPINIESLEALAAEGNAEYAKDLLRELPQDRDDALARINGASPHTGRIRAPLVLAKDSAIMASVSVAPGQHSPQFAADTRASVETALADASCLTYAPAAAVAGLGVRMELAELLGLEVNGRSLYLPTLLEAVGYLGGFEMIESWAATGCFDTELDHLESKLGAYQTSKELLKHRSLLTAGRPAPPTSPGMIVCETKESAVYRVFGRTPWHPDAEVTCLHIYCGHRSQCPTKRTAAKKVLIPLPARISPQDLESIQKTLAHNIRPDQRYEISLGGPVILGAWLAKILKNVPAEVHFLDGQSGLPWWSNKAKNYVTPDPIPAQPDSRRVVICDVGALFIDDKWERYVIEKQVTPERIGAHVGAFLSRYASAPELHVGFKAPAGLVFAIATALHNRGAPTHYYHLDQTENRYVPWFSDD